MKNLILLFCLIFGITTHTKAYNYKINSHEIDALFENAKEVPTLAIAAFAESHLNTESRLNTTKAKAGDNPVVALVLCYFLGWAGIHRLYLGGSYVCCIYCVPVIGTIAWVGDFIVLLIRAIQGESIDDFVGSNRIFVWL